MAVGLQNIIDGAQGLNIDRRKVVGIQYTRNEIPRVSQTPTKNPWKFTLDMPSNLRYSEARALMEALDRIDRITPQVITFGNNPAFSWMFKYQGAMNASQINNLIVNSYVDDQLTLSGLPAVGASVVLFEPNDLIQIDTYPYPFTVVNRVTRGGGSTTTFTVSRPNIISSSVTGYGVTVGNECQFNMFCPNMPTYKLTVGGAIRSGSTVTNNALLEWSDNFLLYEYVGAA